MKTRDGADFHLGMTLIWPSGAEVPTNAEGFQVVEVNGRACLERVESMVSYDLRMFYSSEAARRAAILNRVAHAIGHMEELRDAMNGHPDRMPCFHCLEILDEHDKSGECPYCGGRQAEPVSFELLNHGINGIHTEND